MKIGIDLGGSHVSIGIVDVYGNISDLRVTKLSDLKIEDKEAKMKKYIIDNIQELKQKHDVSSVGIAIPGSVDKERIIKSVNLGIENYNIVKELQEKVRLPISIRNDAKCAALAENKLGSLKGFERVLFLTLGTGVGTAVIIDGELLNAGNLPGCEAGHMVIQKDGLLCNCGKRGCFEKYGSMKAFKDSLRNRLPFREYQTGEMLERLLREKTPDDELNKKIDEVINEYIDYLSIGISNLINIFEPEAIGIGGSFVYFADVLLPILKNKLLEDNILFNHRDDIVIRIAEFGNDAGIIGSVL